MNIKQLKENVERLFTDRIDAEILKRGITESELKTEMTSGVAPVTEAEVQAFYDQNRAQMGSSTLEQVGPKVMQHLTNQRSVSALSDFIANLKKEAGVQIMIEPPRTEVKIAANDRLSPFASVSSAVIPISARNPAVPFTKALSLGANPFASSKLS